MHSPITFEDATKDDCLDRLVPSDLRILVRERDDLLKLVEAVVEARVALNETSSTSRYYLTRFSKAKDTHEALATWLKDNETPGDKL